MCQPKESDIELLESDADLISRWCERSDRQAASVLVSRYEKSLFGLMSYATHDRHVAEELCQETWMDVFKSLDKFIDRGFGIKPWIFKIAVNKMNRYYKLLGKHRHIPLDLLPEIPYDGLRSSGIVIDKADLSMLPEELRQVLTLYFYDNLTFEQISQRIQVPLTTAFKRFNKGKEYLRRILTE
jgi:RNA polymerase sigma-70 factor (ECF subfamily)